MVIQIKSIRKIKEYSPEKIKPGLDKLYQGIKELSGESLGRQKRLGHSVGIPCSGNSK
ncbi:MAG: hypothetical protein QMD36_05645 [Candidatus Aenigmarchaeota archaeon]|nr:hypothetical protein [Candidatus Aenigmarchaeota archaeon]